MYITYFTEFMAGAILTNQSVQKHSQTQSSLLITRQNNPCHTLAYVNYDSL